MFQKIKRQDGFLFTFVSFYKCQGSSTFSFVFFKCCNKVYIYIYIYSADYLHYTWLAKTNHQRILDLWQVHGNFFRINFITSQISIAGIFLGWATELLWTSFSCHLAHFFFFWHLQWPSNAKKEVYLIQKHSL